MKHRLKTLAAALSAATIVFAIPAAANADEVVILKIEGIGEWVVINHEICATYAGQTVCHRWQTHEFRREEQREIRRCETPETGCS